MFLRLDDSKVQLNQLLELVSIELQLTTEQYERAESSYEAVGDWLDQPGTSLAPLRPTIFPQGSFALGTTVKPRRREEFDVDAVVYLAAADWETWRPMSIYRLVRDRLREHKTYRAMLEEKDRCIRLNYAGQFHLDIVPACPSPKVHIPLGETAIVIPDKDQGRWISTNPQGFKAWLHERAARAQTDSHARVACSVKPLPADQEAGSKTPLQRIVQLFKRRRDVHFAGGDYAPKSILITTIDGTLYRGETSLCDGIVNILDGIIAIGEHYRGDDVPVIENPTDPEENLARHWQEDRRHFVSFIEYVAEFKELMNQLLGARGLEQIGTVLKILFDPSGKAQFVDRALNSYASRFQKARDHNQIKLDKRTGGLTTAIGVPASLPVPKTKFWGIQ